MPLLAESPLIGCITKIVYNSRVTRDAWSRGSWRELRVVVVTWYGESG